MKYTKKYCKYCNNSNLINNDYLCLNYSKCELFIKYAQLLHKILKKSKKTV